MWTCQRWKKEEQQCLRCRRFSMTDVCCNPGRTYRHGVGAKHEDVCSCMSPREKDFVFPHPILDKEIQQ